MAECCDGCINTNPANGCSVEEGFNTTANGIASHAEGGGATVVLGGVQKEGETPQVVIIHIRKALMQ